MLKIGDFNVMDITGTSREFYTLELDGEKALLPQKESKGLRIGGSAKVFVYFNGPGDIRATFQTPHAVEGEIASLRVKEALDFGAFLDWGISKDLFVPKRCQPRPLKKGESCIVRICSDEDNGGVIGDCRIKQYIKLTPPEFNPAEEVHLLIYEETPLGFNAVINNEYTGLLYHSDLYSPVSVGDSMTGYIKKVREDGGIDLTLQRQGTGGIIDAAETILSALRDAGGVLYLTDKSSPEEIQEEMQMSKKAFKRGVGSLYKRKLIRLENDCIRLVDA